MADVALDNDVDANVTFSWPPGDGATFVGEYGTRRPEEDGSKPSTGRGATGGVVLSNAIGRSKNCRMPAYRRPFPIDADAVKRPFHPLLSGCSLRRSRAFRGEDRSYLCRVVA